MNINPTLPRDAQPLRLFRFVCATHPPRTYIVLSLFWSMSLMTLLQHASGNVHLSGGMLAVAASFFLILMYLRTIDEIKDLAYDRRHNTNRPLVRGDISVPEAWLLAALIALSAFALNAIVMPQLAWFAVADMGYGIVLLLLERYWRRFRTSILLNLLITFPVSAALNFYAWLYLQEYSHAPGLYDALPLLAAYIAAFLHLEFGRKMKWPHLSANGENGYAVVLGTGGALSVCAALGITACGLATWFNLQHAGAMLAWLPWLALVPSLVGARRFLRRTDRHLELKPYFAGFLLLFFIANLLATLIR